MNDDDQTPRIEGSELFPAGPPAWPPRDPEIVAALVAAYESGDWGRYQGQSIPKLQAELSATHDERWVQCCSSGTIAVELALRGLGVGVGDRVLLAAYDFPGNFASIEAVGAEPVLIDVRPETWTVDGALIADACTQFAPKAAIVSHLHGGLAPMSEIMSVAEKNTMLIVEDFCQCPGATVDSRRVGTWGHISVTSFGGSKLLSAGRGGAILGSDPVHLQRIRIYNDQGNERFPLSELQASVLLPQLFRLEEMNRHRQKQVEKLVTGVSDIVALRPVDTSSSSTRSPAYYKLAFQCADVRHWSTELRALGVAIDAGFRGFVRRKRRCLAHGELSGAQTAADSTMILHHPILAADDEQVSRLVQAFHRVDLALSRGGLE